MKKYYNCFTDYCELYKPINVLNANKLTATDGGLLEIELWIYLNETVDNAGKVDVQYNIKHLLANVQSPSQEYLKQHEGLNLAKNYKMFFINGNIVHGLDRSGNIGQDCIVYDNMKFHVVNMVFEQRLDYTAVLAMRIDQEFGTNPEIQPIPVVIYE